ncbi:MAG: T9SS type A sorting domain-containing protein [Lewinella sp.]|nr:T9SS type A sorting domain-containing protein [Lewinella sp.]
MTRALIIGCFLTATLAFGQDYTPFLTSGAVWNEVCYEPAGEPSSPSHYLHGYQLAIGSDTLVDEQIYRRVTYRRTWYQAKQYVVENMETVVHLTAYNYEEAPILIGGLREDTLARRVYFINLSAGDWTYELQVNAPAGEEILLYDFSLEVGETIDFPDQTTTVTSVFNTPLPDGSVRPTYQFAGSDRLWIEGVGGSLGLLDPLRGDFLESGCVLRCFFEQGDLLASFTQLSFAVPPLTDACDALLSNLVPPARPAVLELWPNPFGEALTVRFDGPAGELRVFNALGQPVGTWPLTTGTQMISLEGQAPGWYFYQLRQQGQVVQRGQLLRVSGDQ